MPTFVEGGSRELHRDQRNCRKGRERVCFEERERLVAGGPQVLDMPSWSPSIKRALELDEACRSLRPRLFGGCGRHSGLPACP